MTELQMRSDPAASGKFFFIAVDFAMHLREDRLGSTGDSVRTRTYAVLIAASICIMLIPANNNCVPNEARPERGSSSSGDVRRLGAAALRLGNLAASRGCEPVSRAQPMP